MTYAIQIKQKGGKWVQWCERHDYLDAQRVWSSMPSLRRKARMIRIEDGKNTVLERYTPDVQADSHITNVEETPGNSL